MNLTKNKEDTVHTPDKWVVFKMVTEKDGIIYKLLAVWDEAQTKFGTWRLNSGISSFEESDNNYYFYGVSGSCYRCSKESYGLEDTTVAMYGIFRTGYGERITMMPKDTDWSKLNWNLVPTENTKDLDCSKY